MQRKKKRKGETKNSIEQIKNKYQDDRFKPHHINITINVNTLMERQRLSVGEGKKASPNMPTTRNIL